MKGEGKKKAEARKRIREAFDTQTADIVEYYIFRFWNCWRRLAKK